MTKNIDIKTGVPNTLRKVMFPTGIVASILGFVWFILYTSGTSSYNVPKFTKDMCDAGRYVAMGFVFLSLALAGLIIAHSILQLVKSNKANIKHELTSGILNAIVGLLMLILFIFLVTKVFDTEKWGEYKVFSLCGIQVALAIFVTAFGRHFSMKSIEAQNTNLKTLRSVAVAIFVIAICSVVSMGETCIGGFYNAEKLVSKQGARNEWITSAVSAKFLLGSMGVVAIGLLFMIPLSILGFTNKAEAKKNIIKWSVIGGIVFVLFVIGAAMMAVDSYYEVPTKWIVDVENKTITVFCMLGWAGAVVGGSMALDGTKKFPPKIVTAA